jgi:hypothetical protein
VRVVVEPQAVDEHVWRSCRRRRASSRTHPPATGHRMLRLAFFSSSSLSGFRSSRASR